MFNLRGLNRHKVFIFMVNKLIILRIYLWKDVGRTGFSHFVAFIKHFSGVRYNSGISGVYGIVWEDPNKCIL